MARYTIADIYSGKSRKYSVLSDAMEEYLRVGKAEGYDEQTTFDMLIVKHTIKTIEKMLKEGDSILEMTNNESLSCCVG